MGFKDVWPKGKELISAQRRWFSINYSALPWLLYFPSGKWSWAVQRSGLRVWADAGVQLLDSEHWRECPPIMLEWWFYFCVLPRITGWRVGYRITQTGESRGAEYLPKGYWWVALWKGSEWWQDSVLGTISLHSAPLSWNKTSKANLIVDNKILLGERKNIQCSWKVSHKSKAMRGLHTSKGWMLWDRNYILLKLLYKK